MWGRLPACGGLVARHYKSGDSSRLRHKYQLATVAYGDQISPNRATSVGFGICSKPYAFLMAARKPKSPVGSTFGRLRANIRNICTVQMPIPLTAVKRLTTSSSSSWWQASKSTSPKRSA